LKSTGLARISGLWETVGMAKKRTKSDNAQRQADELEQKLDRRPEQVQRKRTGRENSSQAAVRVVREATGRR